MTKQETSKRACARYAKLRGDPPQGMFRYTLNRFILEGFAEDEAEARALLFVRERHPGWVPIRASTSAQTAAASVAR
jgi:hypothetical protein